MSTSASFAFTWSSILVVIGFFIAFHVLKSLYRITFHPLAKFPGPKLAAVTYKYEFYYDGIKGGSYIHQIAQMHEKYGPIVRINPNELHCNDPNFIDTIYAGGGAKRDKSTFFLNGFGPKVSGSIFASAKHELHRRRRAAINRYFSKTSITKMEPHVHDLAQTLCSKLLTPKLTGKPFDVTHAYSQFTTDVITSYCFGQSHGFLEEQNFDANLRNGVLAGCYMLPVSKQWPQMFLLVDSLPDSVAKLVSPDAAQFVDHACTGRAFFRDLLESDLPPSEKTVHRLAGEAAGLIGAGSETTAATLTLLTVHLIRNPKILARVTTELQTVVQDPLKLPKWSELEQLVYLGAVITEAIRLSYGVATRLARIAPDETLIYRGSFHNEPIEMQIPAGFAIGMTNVLIHANEDIFPRSDQFLPERWLKEDGSRRTDLERYMLSFSKGSRGCIGINLAYCELYVTLAALVLRVFPRMKLFETTEKDVQFYRDVFVSMPEPSSKGVRVVVD